MCPIIRTRHSVGLSVVTDGQKRDRVSVESISVVVSTGPGAGVVATR